MASFSNLLQQSFGLRNGIVSGFAVTVEQGIIVRAALLWLLVPMECMESVLGHVRGSPLLRLSTAAVNTA